MLTDANGNERNRAEEAEEKRSEAFGYARDMEAALNLQSEEHGKTVADLTRERDELLARIAAYESEEGIG